MGNNQSNITSLKTVQTFELTNGLTSIENKEDLTLIWLNKTINIFPLILQEIIHYVLLYTDIELCIKSIQSINTERIFLIISDIYAEECLSKIHDLSQIDSIFIYNKDLNISIDQFHDLKQQYSKIINIYNNEEELIKSLNEEINNFYKNFLTFSLYKNQKYTKILTKETANFLWFQLFKDILYQISISKQAKNDMIEQCKKYYQNNNKELQLIDEFDRIYTKSKAIHWYTKQYFIYRLFNKALRTKDMEILYILCYYIQDLCKCLTDEYKSFKIPNEKQSIIKYYRGVKLSEDDLNKFQTNIGLLISPNGFFLANKNYNLALDMALKTSKYSLDIFSTLFIIEIDIDFNDIIYSNINEQEILFDINCAFKITNIYFDNKKNLWIINMNLVNDGKQLIENYIEINKYEMEKGNIFLIFGLLLIELEEYNQAQIYFEYLLSTNIIDDKISIYTNIGRIKYLKGLYDEALKDFEIVYNLQEQQTLKSDMDLARTMSNLGLVYLEQGKYDLALDYLFDTMNIYTNNSDSEKFLSANTENALGIIFCYKCDYNHAFEYLFRAMKIYEEYLPTIDHSLMATNYNNIGLVFYYINEYTQSLIYCLKAYNIRKKILPIYHPNIGDSCNNLALIYQKLREYNQSLEYFQQSLSVYENNSNKKMNIPICYNNIGLLYIDQNNFEESIYYYLKALDHYTNNNNENKYQEEIGYTLDNLGIAYEMSQDFEQALVFYKQSLEYQQKDQNKFVLILLKIGNLYQKINQYDLALDYYQKGFNKSESSPPDLFSNLLLAIGIVYHRQNKYKHALVYYKHSLMIRKQISSKYDLNLALIYNNIGCLYDNMDDLNRALKYHKRCYRIRKRSLLSIHPDLAICLINLGHIHQKLAHYNNGNSNELQFALENYKAAFHIRRKSLSNDHPDLAQSYYTLALIHFDQKEYIQAYVEIQKAFNIQKKIFSFDHVDLQQTLKFQKYLKIILDYQKKE